jgi:HAE1 family hydrophobic/amphiphilic exporter-1
MGLTLAAIRRPVFISMFVLALVIMGVRSRQAMPKEDMPDVELPYVTVVTQYAGAGPQEIETLVTKPVEDAVAGVNGLKHVSSTSREGLSIVAIEFELGTSLDAASADVRDKVSAIRSTLPKEATEPAVSRVNISSRPILTIGMAGNMSSSEMRHLADVTVKDAFSKVPGAASVSVQGGDVREVHVEVDKARLQAYGMSLAQVVGAVNAQNINIPGGSIKETAREFAVRMVGEFTSPKQIEDVRIDVPTGPSGSKSAVVRLGDVATVKDTVAEPDVITRLGIGVKPAAAAVVIGIQKQSGGNTIEVASGVKREMARLLGKVYDENSDKVVDYNPATMKMPRPTRVLPAGMDMVIATDESETVRNSMDDVNKALIEGILLVVLIVFLFLHSTRATFIVALAIPTSMFATFLPLKAQGFTLNTMTLLGLSLAVGILVDDSIVVLENIERHLRKGEEPAEAAINGRSEIGLAAIAITFVDVVVFVPIANMGGIVGQFFRPFGWTVACATLFSLFMSFTLTPMLASRFFEKGHGTAEQKAARAGFWGGVFNSFDRFYDSLDRVYEALLAWTLENRALTIWTGWATLFSVVSMMLPNLKVQLAVIVIVLLSLGAALSKDRKVALYIGALLLSLVAFVSLPIGGEFFPEADQGTLGVTVEGPAGQSLGRTDGIVREIGDRLRGFKDPKSGKPLLEYAVETTGTNASGSVMGGGDSGSQYGAVDVKLIDKSERSVSVKDVMRDVIAKTADIPGAKIQLVSTGGMGSSKPITEEVTGPDMDQNVRVANQLLAGMSKIKGYTDLESSWKVGKPEIQFTVDERKVADLGLNAAAIGSAVRTALQGSGDSGSDTQYRESGDEYIIRVQYNKLNRNSVTEVGGLIVANVNGKPIYLKDVATIVLRNAPNEIKRKDRQRLVSVDANIAQGYAQANLQAAATAVAQKIDAGSSSIGVGGMGQMMQESFAYLFSALALAVVLVYMLMAALFESLTTPFVIWLALPQALVGALLGLMVANKTFSMISMIGIIMLVGLVTKNGILIIDYTNTLRSRGKSRRDAILEAGPTRLRPVLMTTFAMIGGMMPTALALSKGSEQRSPMAVAVIGGLILSTVLTLLVIPVTYSLMDDIVNSSRARWVSLLGRRERDLPVAPEPTQGE